MLDSGQSTRLYASERSFSLTPKKKELKTCGNNQGRSARFQFLMVDPTGSRTPCPPSNLNHLIYERSHTCRKWHSLMPQEQHRPLFGESLVLEPADLPNSQSQSASLRPISRSLQHRSVGVCSPWSVFTPRPTAARKMTRCLTSNLLRPMHSDTVVSFELYYIRLVLQPLIQETLSDHQVCSSSVVS